MRLNRPVLAIITAALVFTGAAESRALDRISPGIVVQPSVLNGLPPAVTFNVPWNVIGKISYVTRDGDVIYIARERRQRVTRNGKLDVALLMSLAKSASIFDFEARSMAAQIDRTNNSAFFVHGTKEVVDQIGQFRRIGPAQSGTVDVNESSDLGVKIIEVRSRALPKGTILFLGGTDGSVPLDAPKLWAASGYRVIGINYIKDLSYKKSCLDRVDLDRLERILLSQADRFRADGPVVLVGFSGGADAALMVANSIGGKLATVHAIAPTAWHFNGARGIGCAIPSSPWVLDGKPVPYIMNFPVTPKSTFQLIRRAFGFLSQGSLAKKALDDVESERLKAISYEVRGIQVPVYLYAGELDDLTPSALSVRKLCPQISNAACYIHPYAGHDISGPPASPVYCRSPKEALRGVSRDMYCQGMATARRYVFESVINSFRR